MDPIAQYLKALADPASLVDRAALEKLDARIAKTKDPVARVKLRAQRARAESVDLDSLENTFVEAAPAWIEQEGITPADARAAFEAEGVPRAVLDRIWGRARSSKPRTRKASSGSKKRSRVDRTTIEGAIPPKGDVFTTQDLVRETGASYATVRKVVSGLVDAGSLKEHGPDPQHEGRGKAPILYERK